MNKKKILAISLLALVAICSFLLIPKQEKVNIIQSSDFFYRLPNTQPVNIIWYTEKNGSWKINKCFTSKSEIKGFLDLLEKGQFTFESENDPQKDFIEQNIKNFDGKEKLSVIFYNGQPEELGLKELKFSLENDTFQWAMGQSKLLYQMLMNKDSWINSQPSNYLDLAQRGIRDSTMRHKDGVPEDFNSFDWVEHVYQKQDWLPIRLTWFNMEDISELEPEGIYKNIRFHKNPDVFKQIVKLLANPEKPEKAQIDSKTKLVLVFYVPEKEMLKTRDIVFSLENGVYHGPNGQSQELGALLEKAPTILSDFSSHYEDFGSDSLAELQKGWLFDMDTSTGN